MPDAAILAEDFAEFAEILSDDDDFPSAYVGWERLVEVPQADLAEEGYTAKFLEVRPAGFRRFINEASGGASMNSLAGC